MNQLVIQYNAILKNIATKQNLGSLPLFDKLLPVLMSKKPADKAEFKLNLFIVLLRSAFQKYILRKNWGEISACNGFSVLTDGIHMNDKSGNILADLIQEWILSLTQNPS